MSLVTSMGRFAAHTGPDGRYPVPGIKKTREYWREHRAGIPARPRLSRRK